MRENKKGELGGGAIIGLSRGRGRGDIEGIRLRGNGMILSREEKLIAKLDQKVICKTFLINIYSVGHSYIIKA